MTGTLRLAWRNLGRNRRRTALALAAIALGQLALLAACSLSHGYLDGIRRAVTGQLLGHLQLCAPGWREDRALDKPLAEADAKTALLNADDAVALATARIYAPALVAPGQEAQAAVLVGVDPDAERGAGGLLAGQELAPGGHQVLAGAILARRLGLRPGQELAVLGQGADGSLANDLYTVKGLLRCPADLINRAGLVLSLADARELLVLPGQAHEIVVRLKPAWAGDYLAQARRLRARPELAGDELTTWADLVPELVTILGLADYVAWIMLTLVFIAAVAGIANTLMMATFERRREFGMLLALGLPPRRLVRLVLAEAALLGVLGVLAGTALGLGFVAFFSRHGVDFASWGGKEVRDIAFQGLNLPLVVFPRLEWRDALLGLLAVLFTALIAAVWPSLIAARLEPARALRE